MLTSMQLQSAAIFLRISIPQVLLYVHFTSAAVSEAWREELSQRRETRMEARDSLQWSLFVLRSLAEYSLFHRLSMLWTELSGFMITETLSVDLSLLTSLQPSDSLPESLSRFQIGLSSLQRLTKLISVQISNNLAYRISFDPSKAPAFGGSSYVYTKRWFFSIV